MPSLTKAIEAMHKACAVWSVGYDQYQRDDIYDGGESDCSSLVIWALKQGGFDTGSATYTGNMSANLTKRGWKRLSPDLGSLRPGDILLNDTHHVCMVVAGSGRTATIAQASIDEHGHAHGGRAGDQTGYETNERQAYTYWAGWDCILRYSGSSASTKVTSTPVKKSKVAKQKTNKLAVDGYFGAATIKALQRYLGTPVDGVISSQYAPNRIYITAAVKGWDWADVPKGSTCIKALQRKVGASADGIWGKATSRAVQKWLGVDVDGYFGAISTKALQRKLNKSL